MDESSVNKKLRNISGLHDDLSKKIHEHESFFQEGHTLIERLQPISDDYDNRMKDAILSYVDKIFNELYHIEIQADKEFKGAFQGVITSDVERFEKQNNYLQQWVDFAVISYTIDGDIERALKDAIAELIGLQKHAASGANLGRLYQKANQAYDNLFELRKRLKKCSYERYHEKGQRDTSSQFSPW